MTKKILIIKLGALGDVVRTIPILSAIKEKYPNSEIYWLTKKDSVEILENNPNINKILVFPYNFDQELHNDFHNPASNPFCLTN